MSDLVKGYHEKAKVDGKQVVAVFLPDPLDRTRYISRYTTDKGKPISDYVKTTKAADELIKYHDLRYR